MNIVKTDIYKQLKQNNLIVWAVVICSGCISLFAIWSVAQAHKNADRFIYSISTDEKLLPLEQIEKREVIAIYKKSHIELFLKNFYEYDQWNYKKRLEKALWLINSEDGKKLYDYYKQQGHYNRMVQTTSSQSMVQIKIRFGSKDNFKVSAIIEINKVNQDEPKRYQLTTRGKLEKVSENYPLNPYGFLITDYKETNLKRLENE